MISTDVVVIGGGAAGLHAAADARSLRTGALGSAGTGGRRHPEGRAELAG